MLKESAKHIGETKLLTKFQRAGQDTPPTVSGYDKSNANTLPFLNCTIS